jgi:hypothetical protein
MWDPPSNRYYILRPERVSGTQTAASLSTRVNLFVHQTLT